MTISPQEEGSIKPPSLTSTLESVQALRGFAALLVVISHVTARQPTTPFVGEVAETPLFLEVLSRGYAGVDMFFVISGFIIVYVTQTYARNLSTVGRFLYARASRIYPLWWVFASLLPLYFLTAYGTLAPPDRMETEMGTWTYIFKSMVLWPQSELPVLNVGWTLIHEVFFYLVFSLALLVRRSALPALLLVWIALTLVGSWLVFSTHSVSPVLGLITSHLTLEFVFGAFVGLAVLNRIFFRPGLILILGLVAFVSAMVFYSTPSPSPMLWGRVAVFSLPCCAILYGLVCLEVSRDLKVPSWCVALGNWSFALYLVHPIVIILLQRLSREALPRLPADWKPLLVYSEPGLAGDFSFAIAATLVSIAAAALTHISVERPLLRCTRAIVQRPDLVT